MADKEERILVLTTNNENGECECVTQDGCHANDSCAICNVGMTRQEAIERMAKAIFKRDSVLALDIEFKDLIEQKQNVYRDFAEIALNALLEDK